ncbi:hypothetical protein BYT27DRAFT_7250430 [Phlegmacium glaucopus]|nr:hypothetical protein BYT27DRAFT_7250430 [Phlegmacium glaucopus]
MEKIEAVRQGPKWEPNVAIRIVDNKDKEKEEDRADITNIKVYTDGSGFEGQVGAGAILYRDGVIKGRKRMRLESLKHHMVYEGEGVGMILGLELIREEWIAMGLIPIGVNNTAAITATHTIKPGPGHYIWDLFHRRLSMVNNKHKDMDLLVRWTPGHIDIKGNEEADKEAKAAAQHGSSPKNKLPAPLRKPLPCSKSAVRQAYHTKLKCLSTEIWVKLPQYKKIKHIDPSIPSAIPKALRDSLLLLANDELVGEVMLLLQKELNKLDPDNDEEVPALHDDYSMGKVLVDWTEGVEEYQTLTTSVNGAYAVRWIFHVGSCCSPQYNLGVYTGMAHELLPTSTFFSRVI